MRLTKHNAGKTPAATKPTAPVKAVPARPAFMSGGFNDRSLIAVGSKGAAFTLGNAENLGLSAEQAKGEPVEMHWTRHTLGTSAICEAHAKGKASGVAWLDACAFVSRRGAPVRILPLGAACKAGLVAKVKLTLASGQTAVAYVPAGKDTAAKAWSYYATPGFAAGRVEPRRINDGRNVAVHASVKSVALA